jgi:putative oxidoreductase
MGHIDVTDRNRTHQPFQSHRILGLKIVFGLAFIAAGGAKIYGPPAMVAEFDAVGLGRWFCYFTAALEIIGAILLLTPKTTGFGALLLAGVCGGAFFAQLFALHGDIVHTIVMVIILLAIAWTQRHQISAALGR